MLQNIFKTFFSLIRIFVLAVIYAIKWIIAYIAIRLYNLCVCKRFDIYDVSAKKDPVKLGFVAPLLEKELESPFPESHLKQGSDEVVFYGVNSKSECILVRITRGCNQGAEAWIYLKLQNGKTYHLIETFGTQQPFEGKCLTFSCGKLQIRYLSPMRRWRIFYCGMLKETQQSKTDVEDVVFVKFVFLWIASSGVYDLTFHSNPRGFASAIASSEWKIPLVPPVIECGKTLNFYAQSGVVSGTVTVNDGSDYEMYLFGEKIRNIGKTTNIVGSKFTTVLGSIPEDGMGIHLTKASAPCMFKNLPFGFVRESSGQLTVVKEVDITMKPHRKNSDTIIRKHSVNVSFTAGVKYEMSGRIAGEPSLLYSGECWSGFLEVNFIEFQMNGEKGSGLLLTGEVYKEPKRLVKNIETVSLPQTVPLTVKFTDEISSIGDISGGKGSSLGKLTKLSSDLKTFEVPKGLVVTTMAYSEFLTPEICACIKNLENIAYGNVEGNTKAACNEVASVIMKTNLPNIICQSILKDLKDIFGTDVNKHKFAVRSSATGEDTASMSAAGQMDTFLGVQGLKEIFTFVKKCWASQFSFVAVEYKRHNGQVLNSPMAVVIQEMVACEVSGVLFTCDPVTNNPSFITLTANYGLGETVVSGSVEPDTIVLRTKEHGKMEVHSINIGTKHQKIIMKDVGGTITEDVSDNARNEICLSKEMMERLARLAIKIEKYYKSSRDIEWGISEGIIYMLQSRPITNVDAETDYEITHEFDAPLRSEFDYLTVANVGEINPGALSTLGMELLIKMFRIVFQRLLASKGGTNSLNDSPYFAAGMLTFYNHMMATAVEMMTRYGFDTPLSRGFMISVFGRILDDPDLLKFARERSSDPPPLTLWEKINYFWDLFFYSYESNKFKKEVENYPCDFLKRKTASETFAELLNSCDDFSTAAIRHIYNTECSSNWNTYLFSTLCKDKDSLDANVYSDFARLLSTSSNVESADVPQSMQDLGNQISNDISAEKFKDMSVEEAERWLNTSKTLASQKYKIFLKRHGHRCLKESDVYSIPWEMDSKSLVKVLQTLIGACKNDKKEEDDNKILSELHVPISLVDKYALKFILPNCRRGIRARETSKSLLMRCINNWRKGYRHLGKLMAFEGRLPDADLIFFFTLDELNDLLKTRSPNLLSRAKHRKKLYPILNAYKFPEIMKGFPEPINFEDESTDSYDSVADLTMKGIPVSQGVAKGIARVAISIEDAVHLKPGEILITYSTDTAWSPYFPVVSGVVTELGGLVSHGAVVSREYGLPCVVGLRGATKKFRTGDFVLLDGKKGILQRLPHSPD